MRVGIFVGIYAVCSLEYRTVAKDMNSVGGPESLQSFTSFATRTPSRLAVRGFLLRTSTSDHQWKQPPIPRGPSGALPNARALRAAFFDQVFRLLPKVLSNRRRVTNMDRLLDRNEGNARVSERTQAMQASAF
ncbi:hypothetical protein EMIT0158MI4_60170 [Burkholderia ambifaria]